MTKPRKKKRTPRVAVTPAAAPRVQSNIPAPPEETAQSKGKIMRAGAHLLTSALDYALQHVWGLLGGAIVAAMGVLILYLRAGRAEWLYPWFIHAATFIAGIFTLALIILILAYGKERKRKRERIALEDAKNLRFVSDKLGFIDFFANKEKAEAQLAKVLIPINKEIQGLGKTARKQVKKLTPNTSFTKRQEIATETASILNEHSERIEKQWKTFADLDDTLAESNVGCVNWLDPADDSHKIMLVQQRKGSIGLLASMKDTLPSLQSLRNTVAAQEGASQNLNTAVAHLTFVLDGLIGAMRKSQSRWQNLIVLIDRKGNFLS
jgi:hypothetical protein